MSYEYYLYAFFIAALICGVAVVFKLLFSNTKKHLRLLEEKEAEILKTYNAVETISEEFQDQVKATLDELKNREREYREMAGAAPPMAMPSQPVAMPEPMIAETLPQRPLTPEDARLKAASEVIERAASYIVPERAAETETSPYAQAMAQAKAKPSYAQASPYAQGPLAPAAPVAAVSPKIAQAAYASLPQQPVAPAYTPPPDLKPNGNAPVFQKFFDDSAPEVSAPQYAPAPIKGGSRKDAILALAEEGNTDVEIASKLGITRNEVQLVIGLTK